MISQTFRKLLRFIWFLPGFLLWAAYPPVGERADVLFALAPLMWLSRREPSATLSARRWFVSGAVFWVATLSWMPAIVKNGGPWAVVALGWFALAAYCAAFFAAYGWLAARFWAWARDFAEMRAVRGRAGAYLVRLFGVLVAEPVLWCGLELVRSRFLGGFSWNQLGVVPVNSGFGAPAALGGVYLCSAVVILINGTIAGIAERAWRPERSGFAALRRFGSLETLLAFGLVFGIYKVAGTVNRESENSEDGERILKVALIQRNFPCVFKAQDENPYEVYGKLLENVADLKPDLIVLPESAMCEFGPVDQQGALRFADWVERKTGACLLAGGTRHAEGNTYNSAGLYGSNTDVQTCDKVHLVPFGEFIPGDTWFPALKKFVPVESCTPGELALLDFVGESLGVAICFEDTDSAQVRELARMGAKALVFITNDSWFSHSIEAEQHAWQAVARAIETGLAVVRVGNSGVSGTITPSGRVTWLLGPNGRPLVDRRGTMFDRIQLRDGVAPKTPYALLGDIPLCVMFALFILGQILVKYRHHYEKRRTVSV